MFCYCILYCTKITRNLQSWVRTPYVGCPCIPTFNNIPTSPLPLKTKIPHPEMICPLSGSIVLALQKIQEFSLVRK